MPYKDPVKQKEYFKEYDKRRDKTERYATKRAWLLRKRADPVWHEQEKAKQRARENRKNAQNKEIVLNHYGGRCVCCDETEPKFLTVDHINGDGKEHRKQLPGSGGGAIMHNWLIKNDFPDGFQILCWNCNMAKGIYGECPHRG
jgi:hypothetical protein